MPNRQEKSGDSQNNSGWWLRLLRLVRSKKTGDIISGEIGDNARGNVIGKNIFQNYIQIGTVVIPTWLIVGMTLFLLLAIPIALVNSATLFQGIYQQFVGPTYDPMGGIFNIAVADVVITGGPANDRAKETARYLAKRQDQWVQNAINAIDDQDFKSDIEISPLSGVESVEDLASLEGRIANIAEQLHADVVIYGSLDLARRRYMPAFYINPRLTGAEESTGEAAFGAPIPITLDLSDPSNRVALRDEFEPRVKALAEFMIALAFFKRGNYDESLKWLEQVQSIKEWQDSEGKEILYLWIGSAYFRRSFRGQPPANFSCLVPDSAATDDLGCAHDAYVKANALYKARTAGALYARAHIGLGNYWLVQDWTESNGQRVLRCQAYELALREYEQALTATPTADERSFAELKVRYNMGTAFATGYRNGCGPQNVFYKGAIDAFVTTLETYKREELHSWVARDVGARAGYQLGVVYNLADMYESAIEAFLQVLTISEEPRGYTESWQAIRWKAYVQLGHVYLTLARSDSKPWWQTLGGLRTDWRRALASYNAVIEAKNNLQFGYEKGRDQENENIFVADAYYGKGAIHNLLGQYAEAEESLHKSIRLVEETVDPELRSTLVSLPWVSYVELGRAYAGQERWADALAAYGAVIVARDNQQRVALDLLAAAYFGAAEIHHRQGDQEAAVDHYITVIDLLDETAALAQQAQDALVKLDDE